MVTFGFFTPSIFTLDRNIIEMHYWWITIFAVVFVLSTWIKISMGVGMDMVVDRSARKTSSSEP